ncbi:MAG: ATP-binding protein [Deltaproteobacteria bacterium]
MIKRFLNNLALKTKLLLTMLVLCFVSIGLLFILYDIAENRLMTAVERYTEELASAIQMSVEELTAEDMEENKEILKEYAGKFKKKGVREISVLNNDMEVIASSNPKRIGQRIDMKGKKTGVPQISGENPAVQDSRRNYDLMLPVTVGNEQVGYIHLLIRFDVFSDILKANHHKRLIATTIVFAIGIAIAVFLSTKYVEPINTLAKATERIREGELEEIPAVDWKNEIGKLTMNFNEMVRGLRENKKLEERLGEAEHLSKIGQLASGMAHEIRNPLNFINLTIDHLRMEYEPGDSGKKAEFEELASNIKAEIARLNKLLGDFLDYGKPIKLDIQTAFLEDIIKEAISIADCKIREQKIELNTDFSKNMPLLNLDKEQIKACILNVVSNAIQAMPSGGRLFISASVSGGFVSLRIKDTGEGIKEEDLDKVFNPYFTTKTAGIGLGLAITKRIIEEHKGSIAIESSYGNGAVVSIEFPIT